MSNMWWEVCVTPGQESSYSAASPFCWYEDQSSCEKRNS